MKYLVGKYKCTCGRDVQIRMTSKHLPIDDSEPIIEICPYCNYRNEIFLNSSLAVLFDKASNKPAVFEAGVEEMWNELTIN